VGTLVESQSAEIDHVETYVGTQEQLDAKAKEVDRNHVLDISRKRQVAVSPPMPGIPCVMSLKVLGVTITNCLSASDHIRGVVARRLSVR